MEFLPIIPLIAKDLETAVLILKKINSQFEFSRSQNYELLGRDILAEMEETVGDDVKEMKWHMKLLNSIALKLFLSRN